MTSKSSTARIPHPGTPTGASQVHPHVDDDGKPVKIRKPSAASPLEAWNHPQEIAAVVPGGAVPLSLNGVPFEAWADPPANATGWEALAEANRVSEPAFDPPAGLAPAAGVVVQEPDGRIWMVRPTNQVGGYEVTFPKGRTEGKSLQAAALTEAFEESGLRVRLLRHLIDVQRTQTYTRYYLAVRVGGTPAAMGWESQCVMLVPHAQLASLPLSEPDKPFVSMDLTKTP